VSKISQQTSQLLAGKHALVTGGARGIGAAVTRALLGHGARVTMLGRALQTDAGELALSADGKSLTYVSADVANPLQVGRAFDGAKSHFGPIHIIVNNAGQASSAPFLKTSESLWRSMMSVNLDGTFHCMQAALPNMLTAGWGRIVNIASTAGLTGYGYVSAYCSSKHAVVGLTRSVAVEVATKGITVNAVCPGYTDTDMVKDGIANIVAKTGRTREQVLAEITTRNPQKRLITPDEVAHVVAWLTLPGTESITGQAIAISGGEIM
jgi:NAD(P)-dependent dehydrogenase (short-subunit alcohol dehydrogenase family)